MRVRYRGSAVVLFTGLLDLCSLDAQQAPAGSSYRAATDVIAVTVRVVGPQGQPVGELTARDFEVTIDGRRRQVLSSTYLEHAAGTARIAAGRGASTAFNEQPRSGRPGRTFVIAIDQSSFGPGHVSSVIDAARAFVARVPADDMVALYTLPQGPALAPTTDRAAVRSALGALSGQQSDMGVRFSLSPADVVDITVATGGVRHISSSGTGQSPSIFPQESGDVSTVVSQFCPAPGNRRCAQDVVQEALAAGREMDQRAAASLAGMTRLIKALETVPGRKFILNLTAGLPVSDGGSSLGHNGGAAKTLREQAARSGASVYAVQVDDPLRSDLSLQGRTRTENTASLAREREIRRRTLQELAEISGGALLDARTEVHEALNRVLREASAEYVLGIAGDRRDSKVGAISVRVPGGRDLTLRFPPIVVFSTLRGD